MIKSLLGNDYISVSVRVLGMSNSLSMYDCMLRPRLTFLLSFVS